MHFLTTAADRIWSYCLARGIIAPAPVKIFMLVHAKFLKYRSIDHFYTPPHSLFHFAIADEI